MTVYWDKRVEIPKEKVVIERRMVGGRGYVKYVREAHFDKRQGHPVAKKVDIGRQCRDYPDLMFPTDGYAKLFPKQWAELTREDTPKEPTSPDPETPTSPGPETPTGTDPQAPTGTGPEAPDSMDPQVPTRTSLQAACQVISTACGLRTILDDTFGAKCADALLDCAAGVLARSGNGNEASSEEHGGDTNALTQLRQEISAGAEREFWQRWQEFCKKQGAAEVWLCFTHGDGDCAADGVSIEEDAGEPMGNRWVVYVQSLDGRPVSYGAYRGEPADQGEIKAISDALVQYGIRVKGVYLQEGSLAAARLCALRDLGLEYVLRLKEESAWCRKAVYAFAAKGCGNGKHLVPGTVLFADQWQVQVLEGNAQQDTLTAFLNFQEQGRQITALLDQVNREAERLARCILRKRPAVVFDPFTDYLTVSDTQPPEVLLQTENLQREMNGFGMYRVLSAMQHTPREMLRLCASLAGSEIQRSILRALGARDDAGETRIRSLTGWIALILEEKIEKAAKALNRDPKEVLQTLDAKGQQEEAVQAVFRVFEVGQHLRTNAAARKKPGPKGKKSNQTTNPEKGEAEHGGQ